MKIIGLNRFFRNLSYRGRVFLSTLNLDHVGNSRHNEGVIFPVSLDADCGSAWFGMGLQEVIKVGWRFHGKALAGGVFDGQDLVSRLNFWILG